jgi:addiction module HigA family antidote
MVIEYEKDYLEELYNDGKCKNKKYRFQKPIVTMNRKTTHPGDVLKEELEARGISQKKFSEVLSVPYTQLNEILNGKRPVTTDFALMVEAALGINPELLINMQTRYNMSVALQKKPLLSRLLDIKKACAAVL